MTSSGCLWICVFFYTTLLALAGWNQAQRWYLKSELLINPIQVQVIGPWEEAGAPGENPRREHANSTHTGPELDSVTLFISGDFFNEHDASLRLDFQVTPELIKHINRIISFSREPWSVSLLLKWWKNTEACITYDVSLLGINFHHYSKLPHWNTNLSERPGSHGSDRIYISIRRTERCSLTGSFDISFFKSIQKDSSVYRDLFSSVSMRSQHYNHFQLYHHYLWLWARPLIKGRCLNWSWNFLAFYCALRGAVLF